MIVNICGVPYKIEYCDENFSYDEHLGRIIYSEGVIRINKSCTEEMRKEVLYHEIVHGILWHTGQYNIHNDEPLVQALANAMYNMFELKTMEEEKVTEEKSKPKYMTEDGYKEWREEMNE